LHWYKNMNPWNGKRVLVIGAARQGLALARFLAVRGAQVTINDQNPAEKLAQAQAALEGQPVKWALGGHPLQLLDTTDLLCVSGGVSLALPLILEAFRRGLPVTNDSQIFMDEVPCPVVGITGSAGKTTTTTLVGRMAEEAVCSPRTAWVGGNIGRPLIDQIGRIQAGDLVILELSSFQLELMTRSPHIAAVLNITPNHLDRHGSMQAYTAAKARILSYQNSHDTAVLGREDSGAWELARNVQGTLISFGLQSPEAGQSGTFLETGKLYFQNRQERVALFDEGLIQLRGAHNRLNVLAACALGIAAGFPFDGLAKGVEGFNGVPHRLELVREWNGSRWYNDSIATAPERTIAAIHSFDEPLVLMLGGRDKNLPWQDLARLIHQRVDHVIVFGEAAEKIRSAIGQAGPGSRPYSLVKCAGLFEAVQAAAQVAGPGSVVLFSPGGTSYDEFIDFEERGERFRIWVKQLS
jgi:UDP-N-acetylmuramoylalanine--D-glutamate ligase